MNRIIVSLLLVLMLTSCVAHRDINDMYLVLGAAFDYNPDSEQYEVHVQVAKTEAFTKGADVSGEESYLIFDGHGESLFLAIRDMAKGGRVFFWGHCENYVIGNQLARRGVYETMDFLVRDSEIRDEADLLVANEPIKELITIKDGAEKVPMTVLTATLEEGLDVFGKGVRVQVSEAYNNLINPNGSYLISLLSVLKSDFSAKESPKKFDVAGSAVFKEDKMIGILSPAETRGYNFITEEIKNTLINVKYQGTSVVIENTNSKSNVTMFAENEEVTVLVEVEPRGNIAQVSSQQLDLENPNVLMGIKNNYALAIKQEIEDTIDRAQQMQADFLGFGRVVEIANPELWAGIKERWQQELFPEIEVEVTVKPMIIRSGLTTTTKPEEKYAQY